jgi:hypothetical protein
MWYKLKRIMIWPNGVEKQVRPVASPVSSTVVCDFKASWWGTTTVNELLVKWDFCSQRDWKVSMTTWDNWTLRLLIAATDYSAGIYLWWAERDWAITNKWYSNWASFANGLKQNLIKKAYLKMSNLYDSKVSSSGDYPIFGRWWIFAEFSKAVNSTNRVSDAWTAQSWCWAWFYFPRGDNSNYARYIIKPIDANTQYLALPTTQNLWENHTATWYVDQWVSCLYSRLTLETRWTDPSNFHYRLIVWATWNEYDLWLCSSLWSCHLAKDAWDWRKAGSYVEIDEAYLEFFDGYYIDENWNITTTKPR